MFVLGVNVTPEAAFMAPPVVAAAINILSAVEPLAAVVVKLAAVVLVIAELAFPLNVPENVIVANVPVEGT